MISFSVFSKRRRFVLKRFIVTIVVFHLLLSNFPCYGPQAGNGGGGGGNQSKRPKTNRTWSQQVTVKQLKPPNSTEESILTSLNNKSNLFSAVRELMCRMRTGLWACVGSDRDLPPHLWMGFVTSSESFLTETGRPDSNVPIEMN